MNPLQYAQKAILVNEFTAGQCTADFVIMCCCQVAVLLLRLLIICRA